MALSVYGAILPSNTPVALVGAMQLSSFESGLSLFQDYRRLYYSFSPFDDYIIDNQNNRRALITIEEIENRTYTSNANHNQAQKIADTVEMYLLGGAPDVSFETPSMSVEYNSHTNGNQAQITKTVTLHPSTRVQSIGSTLSYNSDDIVFDSRENVYNYWNQNDLRILESLSQKTFQELMNNLHEDITDGQIYIMNPQATFILMVKTRENQTLSINRDARLIEIEEPAIKTDSSYHSTIDIQVFSSIKEIL